MQNPSTLRVLAREEILQTLKDNSLLSPEEMTKVVATLSAADPNADRMELARLLAAASVLTAYQAEAICTRQLDSLRIGTAYEVLDKLGAGGMGTVYKARHRRMKRLVAIKVLLRSLCQEGSFVQRFQREVETVARLSHPNVVMAYDADEAEVGHFLVMEFVNGRDLASSVQKQGPFPLRQAVNCILQTARGLEYAHGQGIIHRDIKPANLLLDGAGVVKITDLGLARLNNPLGQPPTNSGLTQAGGILGTVDYMSPEQAVDSTTIDHRADIYSLGCTLYFLLTGQALYPGESLMGTLLKHREGPIPALQAQRPDAPLSLDVLFKTMVAKRPGDRYQTMAEVVKALEALEPQLTDSLAPAVVLRPSQPPAPSGPPASAYSQTVDLAPPGTKHDNDLSVLVAEPSRAQAAIIRSYLKSMGIDQVTMVTSGQGALEAVRQQCPNVLIGALHLKDMTGVQLAQELRKQADPTALGFVLISSEAESQDIGSLSQVSNAVVLHKPFDLDRLVEVLNVVSRRKLQVSAAALAGGGESDFKSGLNKGKTMVSPPPASTSGRGRFKVLLVDDSSSARAHLRVQLRGQGFTQLIEVGDGAQAVAALSRDKFDLVVTDYHMPYMDGQGLVGYLRQNPTSAQVPIILITTETDPAKLDAMRQLGVTAICDKSFKPEAVKGVLDFLFP